MARLKFKILLSCKNEQRELKKTTLKTKSMMLVLFQLTAQLDLHICRLQKRTLQDADCRILAESRNVQKCLAKTVN